MLQVVSLVCGFRTPFTMRGCNASALAMDAAAMERCFDCVVSLRLLSPQCICCIIRTGSYEAAASAVLDAVAGGGYARAGVTCRLWHGVVQDAMLANPPVGDDIVCARSEQTCSNT